MSDSLGISCPFVESSGWEAWCVVQNLHNSGKSSWYYCSPVCGSPTWQVWDFVLLWLCPSYCLTVACLLTWGIFILFLWVPVSFCQYIFNSRCSGRRRWVHILLPHHLELDVFFVCFSFLMLLSAFVLWLYWSIKMNWEIFLHLLFSENCLCYKFILFILLMFDRIQQ